MIDNQRQNKFYRICNFRLQMMYICIMVITREIFRYERERRNLTREAFGKLLGMSEVSVQAKELGIRPLTKRDKILLANLDNIIETNKLNPAQ